ncbi:hypothetical protein [Paraburkholderia acidiphila]|uniref:Uncharacterized protein n=1 Tax=Paraburkholderia acidiphila TaxID=2571747 RepID=A0A7Z2JCG5_9BURK|nr:hypothetical protein [Paraburkholderia acidiphila]QGZ58868.1 hypothetical protein FAZ97_28385 [Paraburkholderia acidiphila]
MKKISYALLASLFVAGAASAQTPENGIVTTHDANVASQIEQHARDAQAQQPVVEQDARTVHDNAPHKGAHHYQHENHKSHKNHKKHPAKPAHDTAAE